MTQQNETRPNTCPSCGFRSERPKVILFGTEIFAHFHEECQSCSLGREAAELKAKQEAYRKTVLEAIPPQYRDARAGWQGRSDWLRLEATQAHGLRSVGIVGGSGSGKSSALGVLAKIVNQRPYWISATALRAATLDAMTADGKERGSARADVALAAQCKLLIIDDLSQAEFTRAFTSALFDILEARSSRKLVTWWTSQTSPTLLRIAIAKKSEDDDRAAAIVRRLCQNVEIL